MEKLKKNNTHTKKNKKTKTQRRVPVEFGDGPAGAAAGPAEGVRQSSDPDAAGRPAQLVARLLPRPRRRRRAARKGALGAAAGAARRRRHRRPPPPPPPSGNNRTTIQHVTEIVKT